MNTSLRHWLIALHHRLLPQSSELGILPYVWLVYLATFFIYFFFSSPPLWHWIAALGGTSAFLICYFRAYWVSGTSTLYYIVAICIVGSAMVMINPGSAVFFVYAAAFASHLGAPKKGVAAIAGVVAYVLFLTWWQELPMFFYVPAVLFSIMIGGVNIFQHEIALKNKALKLSQEEVERLATTAERERIARDLHDLIGHTFSMLTMKAQLAQKLFDHDTQRARSEIAELEQISRQALSEVREAVTGYRQKDLASELANAKTLLQSVDVVFTYTMPNPALPQTIDATMAYIVREAVTNLVKHSTATRCDIHWQQSSSQVILTIADNGDCETLTEGNGLNGMRERAEQLGGSVTILPKNGLTLTVTVPL